MNYTEQGPVCQTAAQGCGIAAPKPTPLIAQSFGRLESSTERLMKAVSTLVSRIGPVSRPSAPPPTKNEARPVHQVGVCEVIERCSDLIENQSAILLDAADRVEL